MIDTRRFIYHTLIFGVGGILAQLIPLILLPIYTNYLTPAEYGITDLIFRVSYIVNSVLMVNGVRLALYTFYRQANDESGRRRVVVTFSIFLWTAAAISILFAYGFAETLDVFLKIGDHRILAFGMTAVFLEPLVAIPMALYQVRLESIRFVLTNLTMLVLRLGLCIYLVVWLEMGLWGFLFSQYVVSVVFGLTLSTRELLLHPAKPDFSLTRPIFQFCWPFIPLGVINFFCGNTDRFFMLNYGSYADSASALAAVGLYALAYRLAGFASTLGASPMQQVWTAQMYDIHKQPDAIYVFGNYALRIVFVQTFFVLGISVFATEIVQTLCDSSYSEAARIVPIAGLYTCFLTAMNQLESIFYITRTTQYKLINLVILLPVTIVLMYLLVPSYGIMGAAVAYTSATLINCVALFFITQRFFSVRYPFKRFTMLFVVTASCFLLSMIFGSGIEISELAKSAFEQMTRWEKISDAFSRIRYFPLVWKTCCCLLWCGLVWTSGVLLTDDKEMVTQNLKKLLKKITWSKDEPLISGRED